MWQELKNWFEFLFHHAKAGTLTPVPPLTGGVVNFPPIAASPDPVPVITVPAPVSPLPTMPAGVIGQPNADRLVQCQAAEDARAKWINSADSSMAFWAKSTLPYWWGIDEIAKLFPDTDVAAQYVIAQCNKKMLIGALNRNNENEWALFQVPKGETSLYATPWDAGVVAGPNNLPSGQGFKGIGLAELPALIEANRLLNVGAIPPRGTTVPVAGPGGNQHPRREK